MLPDESVSASPDEVERASETAGADVTEDKPDTATATLATGARFIVTTVLAMNAAPPPELVIRIDPRSSTMKSPVESTSEPSSNGFGFGMNVLIVVEPLDAADARTEPFIVAAITPAPAVEAATLAPTAVPTDNATAPEMDTGALTDAAVVAPIEAAPPELMLGTEAETAGTATAKLEPVVASEAMRAASTIEKPAAELPTVLIE